MFNTTAPLHVTIPTPFLPPKLAEVQREYMGYVVSIEEVVTMVLFIEYFCLPEEREFLREDYTASLMQRFNNFNASARDTDEKFIEHLVRLGKPIPFNINSFLKGWRPPEWMSFINRTRRKFQNHYLFICENIDKIYGAIKMFYQTSPNHNATLTRLSHEYLGFIPKVTRNVDCSLNLVLVKGSII